jgi:hypothetical protein
MVGTYDQGSDRQMNDAQGSAARPGFRHSAARSVRLPSHKSRHLIKGLPLDAFGQLRPLAEFNLLQKRNGHPRGDHAIPQLPLQRL